MAQKKDINIPKITVRKRNLRTDTYALYLDIFYKGKRTRENLELYIIPEISRKDKMQNKKVYAMAAMLKDERELQIMNEEENSKVTFDTGMPFLEYFRQLAESMKEKYSKSEYKNWNHCLNYLKGYCTETTTFRDITPEWCEDFKNYLDHVLKYTRKTSSRPAPDCHNGLSTRTKHTYMGKLNLCIKTAFDEKIIPTNPMKDIKNYDVVSKAPACLTWNEVQSLDMTPCLRPTLKNMFLFSCFTGIRRKDMEKMTWGSISESEDTTTVTISDKTSTGYKVIIPEQAMKYLGPRGSDDEFVFPDFKYSTYMYVELRQWALDAGIMKDFTFHTARHTFAVLLLQFGADIYTVASMLGKSDLSHMDIYKELALTNK